MNSLDICRLGIYLISDRKQGRFFQNTESNTRQLLGLKFTGYKPSVLSLIPADVPWEWIFDSLRCLSSLGAKFVDDLSLPHVVGRRRSAVSVQNQNRTVAGTGNPRLVSRTP